MDNILDIRAAYMATAVTDDDPPKLNQFLKDRGVVDTREQQAVQRRFKAQNWEGHWHKHKRTAVAVLAKQETISIENLSTQYAKRRVDLLEAQLVQAEEFLPKAMEEANSRLDFMDDKALVAYIKVLADIRKDVVTKIEDAIQNGGAGNNLNNNTPATLPNGQAHPHDMSIIAIGVAVLEAQSRGLKPEDIIDAEYREEEMVKREDALSSLQAELDAPDTPFEDYDPDA